MGGGVVLINLGYFNLIFFLEVMLKGIGIVFFLEIICFLLEDFVIFFVNVVLVLVLVLFGMVLEILGNFF